MLYEQSQSAQGSGVRDQQADPDPQPLERRRRPVVQTNPISGGDRWAGAWGMGAVAFVQTKPIPEGLVAAGFGTGCTNKANRSGAIAPNKANRQERYPSFHHSNLGPAVQTKPIPSGRRIGGASPTLQAARGWVSNAIEGGPGPCPGTKRVKRSQFPAATDGPEPGGRGRGVCTNEAKGR
jgi:hypothetical protein